ncbi:MAG: ABC transporter permease [Alphaproteobacteria bacterium]|nr:ABC transporter permease [Alphaproteobacteria bacterium]
MNAAASANRPGRALLRSGRVVAGGVLLLVLILAAAFAPWLAPHDPAEQDLLFALVPPAWDALGDPKYPLGTDSLGRCVLSQLIYGARVALIVAVCAATGAMLLGVFLALIAGYFGGRVDWLISRAVDLWMSFPPVILSLILMVGFGVGVVNVILAIVLVDWTRFCRVIRSEVLVVCQRDYIPAARLLGFSHLRTLWREVLPSVAPLIVTLMSLEMGIAVIVEAILSFVGLSVEADVPAWGVMIADGRDYVYQAVWGLVFPILAIMITVFGFNLLGDGLRLTLDPRLQSRQAR